MERVWVLLGYSSNERSPSNRSGFLNRECLMSFLDDPLYSQRRHKSPYYQEDILTKCPICGRIRVSASDHAVCPEHQEEEKQCHTTTTTTKI